jgi:thiamine-monophosphate kinase
MGKLASENSILQRIERAFPRSKSGLRLGLGDDAALWEPAPGFATILTCDWFLEGTHFWRAKHSPDVVGWKCLARATSDIAAMGGIPRTFLLSLALPASHTGKWLDEFLGGLRRASGFLGCQLAGGDTTRNEKILINISVVGEVRKGHAILRSGARPGDILYVSGTLGEAQLGLQQLRRRPSSRRLPTSTLKRHFYPEPRLKLGQWLSSQDLATAMMDISDGLSSDLPRLCAASQVGASVLASSLPKVPRNISSNALKLALNGGDDYELLFTVARSKSKAIPVRFGKVRLSAIGEITKTQNVILLDGGRERALSAAGWDAFKISR